MSAKKEGLPSFCEDDHRIKNTPHIEPIASCIPTKGKLTLNNLKEWAKKERPLQERPETKHTLAFAFDGTGDNKYNKEGIPPSNIAIINDLINSKDSPGLKSFYFKGPGTQDFVVSKKIDGALAYTHLLIIREAYAKLQDFLEAHPKEKVSLVISGFSRGAAIARYFMNILYASGVRKKSNKNPKKNRSDLADFLLIAQSAPLLLSNIKNQDWIQTKKLYNDSLYLADKEQEKNEYLIAPGEVDIRLAVLFDTVSTSMPYKQSGLPIPPIPGLKAYQFLSIDEHRAKSFKADSIIDPQNPHDPRLQEIWISGSHHDIANGGYKINGIGQETLEIFNNLFAAHDKKYANSNIKTNNNKQPYVIHDSWLGFSRDSSFKAVEMATQLYETKESRIKNVNRYKNPIVFSGTDPLGIPNGEKLLTSEKNKAMIEKSYKSFIVGNYEKDKEYLLRQGSSEYEAELILAIRSLQKMAPELVKTLKENPALSIEEINRIALNDSGRITWDKNLLLYVALAASRRGRYKYSKWLDASHKYSGKALEQEYEKIHGISPVPFRKDPLGSSYELDEILAPIDKKRVFPLQNSGYHPNLNMQYNNIISSSSTSGTQNFRELSMPKTSARLGGGLMTEVKFKATSLKKMEVQHILSTIPEKTVPVSTYESFRPSSSSGMIEARNLASAKIM